MAVGGAVSTDPVPLMSVEDETGGARLAGDVGQGVQVNCTADPFSFISEHVVPGFSWAGVRAAH